MSFLRYTLLTLAALAFAFTSLAPNAHAGPKTFQDWAEYKKLEKKIIHGRYPLVKSLRKAGVAAPKRVGLITFYILDTGDVKFSAMAATYGGTYKRTHGLTLDGANHFASKLAKQAVPEMKKAFAEHGMELLTPDQFLQTKEQAQALKDFRLRQGKSAKVAKKLLSFFEKRPNMTAVANGFKYIPAGVFIDAPSNTSLEELRVTLGLDALVAVKNRTYSSKKQVHYGGADIYMFGHNPTPRPEMKIARIAWSPGMPYASATFAKGYKKPVEIAKMKKGKIKSETYDGFGKIMGRTTSEMLRYFEENYNKGK